MDLLFFLKKCSIISDALEVTVSSCSCVIHERGVSSTFDRDVQDYLIFVLSGIQRITKFEMGVKPPDLLPSSSPSL